MHTEKRKMVAFPHAFVLLVILCGSSVECRRPLLRKPRDAPTTGRYFVVLNDKAKEEDMQELLAKVVKVSDDAKVYGMVTKVAKAFTVKLSSPYAMEMVRHMAGVDYIEEEGFATGDSETIPWHLDRLDQDNLPLDLTYGPIGDGSGADVYILDSGINYDHEEFEYRAKYCGYDPVDEYFLQSDSTHQRQNGRDCHGHGTHVASLCGGKYSGSAKGVCIFSVRVLHCGNSAPWSVVLDGLDYVMRTAPNSKRPSIISMSLSGDFHKAVNDALIHIVARGIHVVTVAGNGKKDACTRSPASSAVALTVGGTRDGDGLYTLGSGTNFGECVDIFAPGERIIGADMDCNNCSKELSGTSMAAPMVSGLAAIHLTRQPLLTPAELKQKFIDESIQNLLNYDGIPEEYWPKTANRLVNIPGSCGGRVFVRSHAAIMSPNFPQPYPPNLDCEWYIEGDEQERINLNLTYLNLEDRYDWFKIYDGPCCDETKLVEIMTGNQGSISYILRSTTNVLCLQLHTDCKLGAAGLNGTYTKFYAGTDLKVPDIVELPTLPSTTPQQPSDLHAIISVSPRQARSSAEALLNNGYRITWTTTYNTGTSFKPYMCIILTNSTQVCTKAFLDLNFGKMNETIFRMQEEGYFAKYISDRRRGNNPSTPSYSAVFVKRPDHIETQVFLRDSVEMYNTRLIDMKSKGFRLISHSFCEIKGKTETTSVYIRDERILHNITIGRQPTWISYYNRTFLDFTGDTLRLSRQKLYPIFVETNIVNGESRFATIYLEQLEDIGTWYRWGVSTEVTRETFNVEEEDWEPVLCTSYNYNGLVNHFFVFRRRQYYY